MPQPDETPRTRRYTGFARHFSAAAHCRFHITTEIGDVVVSTVGAYVEPGSGSDGWDDVGHNRKFETYVFRIGRPCTCESRCGTRVVADWGAIDSRCYGTAAAATDGHEAMCVKWETEPVPEPIPDDADAAGAV